MQNSNRKNTSKSILSRLNGVKLLLDSLYKENRSSKYSSDFKKLYQKLEDITKAI